MSLIPAPRKQRQIDLCESEINVVYTFNSRLAKATVRPCLKKKNSSVYSRQMI